MLGERDVSHLTSIMWRLIAFNDRPRLFAASIFLALQPSLAPAMSAGPPEVEKTPYLEQRERERLKACGDGPRLEALEVWKGIDGMDAADRFLREQYVRIGSIRAMADWLICQGFRAYVKKGTYPEFKDARSHLLAVFETREHGRPLWQDEGWVLWPQSAGISFRLYFDANEKPLRTTFRDVVK